MSDHEHLERIKEVYLAAPIMQKIIERRRKVAMTQLLQNHRSGSNDHVARVAELTVLCDLENDIMAKANEYQTIVEAQHATKPNR